MIYAGSGNDQVHVCSFEAAEPPGGVACAREIQGGSGHDVLTSAEDVYGGSGNDVTAAYTNAYGNSGNDHVSGLISIRGFCDGGSGYDVEGEHCPDGTANIP